MTGPSRAEFVEFVRAAEFAVLATASPQGRPEAALSFQVEGTARLVTGAERTRYETVYTARFPGSRVTDAAFVVIVVMPNWVRRYDATVDPPLVQEADWPDHQATVCPR